MKEIGFKCLNLRIPIELHVMLKKLSADENITITEIMVQYLKYLKKQNNKQRESLNVKTAKLDTFKLDTSPARFLPAKPSNATEKPANH